MTFGRLLGRNLLYHWRGNLAVCLGVVVGTAVLTGALLVGDSLRGSLRALTERRLGWVEHALVSGRFLREELAKELSAQHVAPAILLQGAASTPDRRVGRVSILGVDARFWPEGDVPVNPAFWAPAETADREPPGIVLSAVLARELDVHVGATVTLNLQKVSSVPREAFLGRREASEVVEELRLPVRAIVGQESLAGRYSLQPTPAAPRNAVVPLAVLQGVLQQRGRVNALLARGDPAALQESLQKHLTLDDWGLVLYDPDGRAQSLFEKLEPRNPAGPLRRSRWRGRIAGGIADLADKDGNLTRERVANFYREQRPYLSLESRQMLLEPALAEAAIRAAQKAGLREAPTLVYLANRIAAGKDTSIPYSLVAALDAAQAPPLGPFLPSGKKELRDDEMVLADWPHSPLHAKPGDTVTLTYFLPEIEGRLQERTTSFRLAGYVPLQGVAADPDLTPEFPGITDKLDLRDWNPPFPYDNKRIQPRDEQFWQMYRTTPKAYVTLATGQRLWGSRFGDVTSLRLAPAPGGNVGQAAEAYLRALREELRPELGGLRFDAIRENGLQASTGGTDFGMLFLSFSFFLIVAALLLVGLLFRLNLDRRASEIGLLMAVGHRIRNVRWLLLGEGSLLAAAGAIVGSCLAVVYARLLLDLLTALWPGGLERSFLQLHATPQSFLIGFAAAFATSVLTIFWATRVFSNLAPRALLAGATTAEGDPTRSRRPPRWSLAIAVVSTVIAGVLLVLGGRVQDHEAQAMTFFGSGALLLIAALAGAWAWMHRTRRSSHMARTIAPLGVRNATRHPVRSLLTMGLLAAATFLIVAVESFHRDPGRDFLDKDAGSGGFTLLGETNLPIYQDLNTEKGRDELRFPAAERQELQGVHFYDCRLRTGDDASCLNLYQPRRPRVLGVPRALIERGGFRFAASEADADATRANPWLLLRQPSADGSVPALADATTAQWMLKTKLGGVLEMPDQRGQPAKLRIVGLLQDSIFQSELLVSEENFLKLYPALEGYNFYLIQTPPERSDAVKQVLEKLLADRGFEAMTTTQRLAAYLAVENTYLTTFQALGGLGLLLGAMGLAVVLVRSIWERRGELALLRALGFRRSSLGWLVMAENGFLLVLGLAAGAISALLAVAPHLLGGAADVPWWQLVGLLALVLSVGLLAATCAMAATLRAPLLPALRRE